MSLYTIHGMLYANSSMAHTERETPIHQNESKWKLLRDVDGDGDDHHIHSFHAEYKFMRASKLPGATKEHNTSCHFDSKTHTHIVNPQQQQQQHKKSIHTNNMYDDNNRWYEFIFIIFGLLLDVGCWYLVLLSLSLSACNLFAWYFRTCCCSGIVFCAHLLSSLHWLTGSLSFSFETIRVRTGSILGSPTSQINGDWTNWATVTWELYLCAHLLDCVCVCI